MTVTNQNLINEEVLSRSNSGNVSYSSVPILLSSRVLSKNIKIKIYKNLILPEILYGFEIWSLTLRGEHRLRVYENRMVRGIFRSEGYEIVGGWTKLHIEELHNCTSSETLSNDQVKQDEICRVCSTYGRE
jgi:hypothetical protein